MRRQHQRRADTIRRHKRRADAARRRHQPSDVVRLAHEACANWTRRGCVLGRRCLGAGARCRWFEGAVLPDHPEFATAYERATAQRRLEW